MLDAGRQGAAAESALLGSSGADDSEFSAVIEFTSLDFSSMTPGPLGGVRFSLSTH